MKTKKIFKRTIALALREKGFKIITTEPNKCRPQYDVYIFEDTSEFQSALRDVLSNYY